MNKKVAILSLLLLVAVVLAGGVFWYTKNKPVTLTNQVVTNQPAVNEVVNTNQPLSDQAQIIPPTKTDCADELDTTCWNTYKNTEYGFLFKYNKNLLNIAINDIFEGGTKGQPSFNFVNNGGHVAMGLYPNSADLSAQEWLNEQYFDYSGGWKGGFEVNSINGKKAVIATQNYDCYIKWVIFSTQRKLFYTFRAELCGKALDNLQILDNLINSFNFIE